jgi:GT2 family glycosyltransferase
MDARLPRRGGGWEVLDEDFFRLKEDVDLAWRLQRLGWRTWYEPAALAWHGRTGHGYHVPRFREILRASMSDPADTRALSWRNQRLMQAKNDPLEAMLRDLPWILRREAMEWYFAIYVDRARIRALPGLVRAWPGALRKRRALARRIAQRRRAGARPGLSS